MKCSTVQVIRRFFLLPGAFALAVLAQVPAPAPTASAPNTTNDPLGRSSPQAAIIQFLEAGHSRDYFKAQRFLDLRSMSSPDRAKQGPVLAKQLEDLLDGTGFDIANLSRASEGDRTDNLAPNREHLATFKVGGHSIEMQMEKVELRSGLRVWVVSSDSVQKISDAHRMLSETWLEKQLPQQLVTIELLETPIWRWIALIAIAIALWSWSRLSRWQ